MIDFYIFGITFTFNPDLENFTSRYISRVPRYVTICQYGSILKTTLKYYCRPSTEVTDNLMLL